MSLTLISFSISLLGIIAMIWRKVALFRRGYVRDISHSHPFALDLEKLKYFASKIYKKIRYGLLFIVLKSSIKTSNFLKVKSSLFMEWINYNIMRKSIVPVDGIIEKREVSKYLRIISEYQKKVRNMKYRIKREEGIE